MEYKTLTFSNMTTYTRDSNVSTSFLSSQNEVYDLSEYLGFKPWSDDSIEKWEFWLDRLRIEENSLEEICSDHHILNGNVDYELDGLEKVRRAIAEAEQEIAAAKRLDAEKLPVEEDVEERAERMASETENIFLEGLPGAEKDPQEELKPWVPSWYPNPDTDESGGMFVCETGREKWLGLIPDGVMPDYTHKSNFTYYPEKSRFNTQEDRYGRSLGPWGGGIQELPWWQGWNLVGHGVLILVKRCHGTQLGNPDSYWDMPTHKQDGHRFYHGTKFYLECEEPEAGAQARTEQEYGLPEQPDYCWMFALVDGWNGDTKKHSLVFLDNGCFYTVSEVNLRNCVFQEWTRPSLRRFKGSPSGDEENYSTATNYSGYGGTGVKQPGELWKSVPGSDDELEEGEIRE